MQKTLFYRFFNFSNISNEARTAICIVFFGFFFPIYFSGANVAFAQTNAAKNEIAVSSRKFNRGSIKKRGGVQSKLAAKNNSAANNRIAARDNPVFPVAVVNHADTDYLSGEASVAVNPKQPTVIRLGLAQNAVSVVEFPASDGVYYIHEGNPKLASVFQSPTRETDRSITIYPGEAFIPALDGGRSPAAAITLQMRSGLVLILELVPVADIRKNAHRCVVGYNRDDVVAARRSAGLAYNLGEDTKQTDAKNVRAVSKLVAGGIATNELQQTDKSSEENVSNTDNFPARTASLEITKGSVSRKENEKTKAGKMKTGAELSLLANRRLADCLKNPKKNLGAWSPAARGLTLAVSRAVEIDAEQRLVVVAVRNETTGNLRLVPGAPELEIQTADKKGNALQVERLERSYIETTSLEGLILPGSIGYYAIVYRAPVMGANQRLRVSVSHREAADSPASISLGNAQEK